MNRSNLFYDQVKSERPNAFEILKGISFLKGTQIRIELILITFKKFSKNELYDSLSYLDGKSLISISEDGIITMQEQTKNEVTQQISVNLEEKAFILDEIVLGLNNTIMLESVEKNAYNVLDKSLENLFHHAVHVLKNDWPNKLTNKACAELYTTLGFIYEKYLLEYQKSLEMYAQALFIHKQTLPENHESIGAVLNKIGVVYRFQGKYELALKHSLEALRIRKIAFGTNHILIAETYNSIAMAYDVQGKLKKALMHFNEALNIYKSSAPSSSASNIPFIAGTINNIAGVYDKVDFFCSEKIQLKHPFATYKSYF